VVAIDEDETSSAASNAASVTTVATADGASVYLEFSVDGATGWHFPFAVGDKYERQKVGAAGAWSDPWRINATDGTNGQSAYFHYKFSNDGGATFTASGGDTVGKWIGTYSDNNPAASVSPAAYTWILLQGYIDPTPPANPAAPTLASSSAYLSGDGTVFSRLVINVPPMPAGGYLLNVLCRKNGSTGWVVMDQWDKDRNPATRTSTIDDLAPGQSYEVAVQAFSFDLAPSAIVLATGSPFTASNKNAGPANATGFAAHAPSSSFPIPPRYYSGVQFMGCTVTFTPSADRDVAGYEWALGGDAVTPPLAPDQVIAAGNDRFLYYSGTSVPQWLWFRSRDRSGNYSAWAYTGLNLNAYLSTAAGSMSVQDSSNVSMTGVKTGSGASVRQILAVYPENYVTDPLTGGASSEIISLNISNRGFSARPDVGDVVCESDDNIAARYLAVDGATSTSTTAYIKLKTKDGSNLPAGGRYRLQIKLTEYA
jgi:hypothetical protein